MNKNRRSSEAQTLVVLALFCIFTASVLMVLMLGTKIYRAMGAKSDAVYAQRTALCYISEKISHQDIKNGVRIGSFGDSPALFMEETIAGTEYETTIYVYEGKLCELFCEKGLGLSPDSGSAIMDAYSVDFELYGSGLMEISYTSPEGKTATSFIHLRAGRVLQ